MARILAAIGLAIAGAMPLSAGALGLGEIDLKSALNQSFSAEIPVLSEASGDIEALRVVIAPVETFKQFGLDRPAFLADFKFSIIASDTGAVVQITSTRPVVEPFVTLLLEISWPQGRLLREYTVLLDPPVFMTESVEAAVEAPTAGPSFSTPLPSKKRAPVKSTDATSPRVAQPAVQPDVAENDGGMYGPVKRNDTLWAIAGGLVAETTSVSRNQMMLAIYQANPEAFTGNINRLKAGMILRIPSASEVELGSRDATAEVRRQNDQWRSTRNEPQGGRLRLVPPPDSDSDTEPAETAAQTGADEGQPTAVGAADTDALQGRAIALERQLDESQRQLQIRDQELEALQRQLAEISSQPQAAPVTDESVLAPEFDEQTGGDVEPLLLDDSVDASEDQAVAPAPVDVTPAQVKRDEPSFLGALFTNPLVYISLAIVLLLVWLFVRNRSKTAEESATGRWDALDEDVPDEEAHEATTRLEARPPQDTAFVVEEGLSIPDEATDDGAAVSPFASGSSEDWGGLAEESETPLERTISADSAVNLDQADPIAESDFHMAYGLYDQAADLLTRAVESEPERKDLRMKLLEVYFIWESQEGFLREAEALQQQIGDTADPDWNKVLIMGKQICPDEALFAGDAAPASLTDSVDLEFGEDAGSDVIDIALDESSEDGVDLEFDEVAQSLDLDLTGEVDSDADSVSGGLDFDIGSEDEATQLVDDDEAEISGEAPTMETPTIESPAMDSTMESPTIESPAMDSTMESPTIESPAMDSTMETPTIESPAMDSTMESPTIESKIGQWGDDSNAGSEQTAEVELADLDLELSGLEDIDDDDADIVADALVLDDVTQQQPAVDDASGDIGALNELADDAESTAEMRNLDEPLSGDTAEQPFVSGGDTAEQVNLAAVADDDVMLDVGEPVTDDGPTAEMDNVASSVDGATMTEVGTKLDLARAYIDMGDPEGARSILNEVLEEADDEQKQEAQKLLDDLVD